ncbi:MAG TPA: sigma-70 family RNA polymerase sigma factor [Isosphaeraceae bacterium]|nr:sigma-70 family RNA polymerase sigma factor [Isosphaeraceae bacterium]
MSEQPPVNELVEHLFRHQAGQMLASLSHIFGLENLDLAEEVVQEALLQALRQWPFHGIPENPRRWLIQVARNKALDRLRRRASLRRKEHEIEQRLQARQATRDVSDIIEASELEDEQLAMIFACCNPALPSEARVALTLKAVSGFSVAEIARAFLTEEGTIAQRLVRAKRRIQEAGITLALPPPADLPGRLDSVLQVLYLLFSEGYGAHAGENLVREDLCGEAMRLAQLLAARPSTALPKVRALLALFYFQAARLSTRVDCNGNLLLLAEQQRTEWDQALLARGLRQLEQSAQGDEVSEYHLQAGIAVVHATSASFDDTDWPYLLGLYDQLLARAPSPVVALNRAIALSMVKGPEAALQSLEEWNADPAMKSYYLLPAVRADLLRRLGRTAQAADCYRQALSYPCTEPERRFLLRRLQSLGQS